jgi:UDP-glucose 4-epimerase
MNCLVTGGAGFIGSNLVDELLKRGHEVVCVDDESADSNLEFYWNESASNYLADINDYGKLLSIFETSKPEVVFHTAAEARIQPSMEEPQKACTTNFVGTCNVLEACRKFGTRRLIYSSTSSAYGFSNSVPFREDMTKDCLTPYSVSKTAGEELCKVYSNIYRVETITLRYFNVYGERQPIKGHYAPVVGLFLRQARVGKPMTIIGDGLQTRDFTHVSDVLAANMLASATQNKRAYGEIFNIGTGKSYSIIELVDMIKGDFIHVEKRKAECRDVLADNSKAREILGWEPEISLSDYLKGEL